MKKEVHPKYYNTKATCVCGAAYEIGSTKENIRLDICSACHPLFTGKQKLVDIGGRVQKFKKKYDGVKVSSKKPAATKKKKPKKKKK